MSRSPRTSICSSISPWLVPIARAKVCIKRAALGIDQPSLALRRSLCDYWLNESHISQSQISEESIKSESGVSAVNRFAERRYQYKNATGRNRKHPTKACRDRKRVRSARL